MLLVFFFFFFSSRRRHTRLQGDWSSDVCSSDLTWPVSWLAGTESGSATRPTAPLKVVLGVGSPTPTPLKTVLNTDAGCVPGRPLTISARPERGPKENK